MALTSHQVRVLVALADVHRREGRATVRLVALAAGGRNLEQTHNDLVVLRAAGLAAWTPGAGGTLRPLVARVR